MRYSARHYIIALLILLALLACGLPGLPGQPAATPTATVSVSQDAAQSMEAKLEEVRNTPAGEEITLTLTEREVTSYIAVNMPQDSRIQDVNVRLHDGLIDVSGKAPVGPLTQDLILRVRPSVQNGNVALEVTEATVGSIDIPERLVQTANDQIRRTISANDQIGTVKQIDISDGTITIVATRR